MHPPTIIAAFDEALAGAGLSFSGIVIGGTALALIGVVIRPTRDCDVLDPPIPVDVLTVAKRFASHRRNLGEALGDDWLNNGPASLTHVLPEGWRQRLVPAYAGRALILQTLGRRDLVATKLFALCDRGTDLGDCLALAPTADELADLRVWLEYQDANTDWPAHTRQVVQDLSRRLGHGL